VCQAQCCQIEVHYNVFWKEVKTPTGVSGLSSAYHPQKDGPTDKLHIGRDAEITRSSRSN